jgi:hypothetical protein
MIMTSNVDLIFKRQEIGFEKEPRKNEKRKKI